MFSHQLVAQEQWLHPFFHEHEIALATPLGHKGSCARHWHLFFHA